jgi:hypothetical protein
MKARHNIQHISSGPLLLRVAKRVPAFWTIEL